MHALPNIGGFQAVTNFSYEKKKLTFPEFLLIIFKDISLFWESYIIIVTYKNIFSVLKNINLCTFHKKHDYISKVVTLTNRKGNCIWTKAQIIAVKKT